MKESPLLFSQSAVAIEPVLTHQRLTQTLGVNKTLLSQ